MAPRQYRFPDQLFKWLELRNKTIAELAYAVTDGDESVVIGWLNGEPMDGEMVRCVARFFDTSTSKLCGRKVCIPDMRPCGVNRVMEILNSGGMDYLNDNEDFQQARHVAHNLAHKKGWHQQTISDEPQVDGTHKREDGTY